MTYLLMPPSGKYLLPALCATSNPVIAAPIRPDSLTATQEEVLLTALVHQELVEAGRYTDANTQYGAAYFAVSSMTRTDADGLVLYGYLAPHPRRALKMWYRLTDEGKARAEYLRRLREENPPTPWPLHGTRQEKLEHDRRANLDRLTQELSWQGFVVFAEGGRGPHMGEQAYYNMFTRETRLYVCQLGTAQWEERIDGYYKADPVMLRQQVELGVLPI